ncbi:MAG: thiamine diphosphokinase [Elusimicrobiota bacterium]|jgi:thiamine pyrophosphokinase|nr:thiamine diphosphokinase [Elusimicrobiota bacterium]
MRKINNLLIIANGQKESAAFLKAQASKSDFILALDGGADTALKAKIMPDAVVGDLDSISPAAKAKIPAIKLFKIARQDNTDFEKGLNFATYIKPQSITVVCATGGRLDFTLGNFSSVFSYTKKLNIVFKGQGWRLYPLEKSATFKCKKGATVSLIPMGKASGITLTNLKYPLKDATLTIGQTAVSNVALKDKIKVEIKSGRLLAIIYD